MKLLSNFDTKLYEKQIAKAVEIYGQQGVLFVRRDMIYLIFKFYLPLLFVLALGALAIWGIVSLEGTGFFSLVRGGIWILLISSLVYFCRVSVGKFIDHYMDYMIITPDEITSYDQEGILQRSSNSLDASKIKSISIKQGGLLGSIFNYGSIIFYSEGDTGVSDKIGQIQLNYIRSPRSCKKRIARIISMGVHSSQQYGSLEGHRSRVEESEVVAQ